MRSAAKRLILVDPCPQTSEVLARRLRAQGYTVDATADAANGADMALRAPPAAMVADLWMPSISGVQLCRLLRAEPPTATVPVILCGETDDPRSRFWAEHAGATTFVCKGRMGELLRALAQAIRSRPDTGEFFVQLSGGQSDISDRIARHLDAALFDSVIAAEVRALATCGSFERLFDRLSQLMSQLLTYRWMAVTMTGPACCGLHRAPDSDPQMLADTWKSLQCEENATLVEIVDGDACAQPSGPPPISCEIPFGDAVAGKLVVAPADDDVGGVKHLCRQVARELGGPLRIATLMDEQQRLATIDPLTGLMNRRSFVERLKVELARASRYGFALSVVLLDIDHFKTINDTHGHSAGDQVLSMLGELLRSGLRTCDLSGRWGGEEFVLALPNTGAAGAETPAERLRRQIEDLHAVHRGAVIPITASIGLTEYIPGEPLDGLIDRADRAMYEAKSRGRNRVVAVQCPPNSAPRSGPPRSDDGRLCISTGAPPPQQTSQAAPPR